MVIKHHYVYCLHQFDGTKYIGVRSSLCQPEEDPYWGSSKYVSSISTVSKEIIREFKDRKSAEEFEVSIHTRFDVGNNSLYANRSTQKASGFSNAENVEIARKISEANKGRKPSRETRRKLSKRFSGTGNPMYGRQHSFITRSLISLAQKRVGTKTSVRVRGERNPCAKLTEQQVRQICLDLCDIQNTIKNLSVKYNVSVGAIQSIRDRTTWSHVSNEYDIPTSRRKPSNSGAKYALSEFARVDRIYSENPQANLAQIAKMSNVSYSQVRRYLLGELVYFQPPSKYRHIDKYQEVCQLLEYNPNYKLADLVRITGFSQTSTWRLLQKYKQNRDRYGL